MYVQKLDRVVIRVNKIEESIKILSELLNTRFDLAPPGTLLRGKPVKVAMSPLGVELIEGEPLGVRSVVLKVADLEVAKVEMKKRGFTPITEFQKGKLKELIYNLEDILGVPGRFVLAAYDVPYDAMIALSDKPT